VAAIFSSILKFTVDGLDEKAFHGEHALHGEHAIHGEHAFHGGTLLHFKVHLDEINYFPSKYSNANIRWSRFGIRLAAIVLEDP
jgi:hypothetical protein